VSQCGGELGDGPLLFGPYNAEVPTRDKTQAPARLLLRILWTLLHWGFLGVVDKQVSDRVLIDQRDEISKLRGTIDV
jgi:hypothetical protein